MGPVVCVALLVCVGWLVCVCVLWICSFLCHMAHTARIADFMMLPFVLVCFVCSVHVV